MIQLLLLGILLLFVFYAVHAFVKSAPSIIGRKLRKGMMWLGLLLLLGLAATGRLGWLIPLVGVLAATLLRLAPLLLEFAALLQRHWRRTDSDRYTETPKRPSHVASMSREEAYEVLGLTPGASREQVMDAHKRLIQKMHPDRGGSNYLAAKLNQARETLLGI